jgi:uroporphyrinogen-III synthase
VAVTRPKASAAGLASALRARGAVVIFAPLIRTRPPRSWTAIDAALRRLPSYDAAVFSSVNAVEAFFERASRILGRRPAPPRLVGAVGAATARALADRGWKASVVPEDAGAGSLSRLLGLPRGARVLLPRAERGLRILPRALAKAGVRVDLATAYRTVPDAAGRRALARAVAAGADAVCFASGSAVSSAAVQLTPSRFRRVFTRDCAAVAIGKTTAAALAALGVKAAAIASSPDADDFAEAVVSALRRRER